MKELLHRINEGLHDMCYIWLKEIKMAVKDEGVLIFFILVPLLYPLLYSWIYNNEVVRDIPVAVVDKSHSATSRQFLRMYDASPDVKVAYHCDNLEEAKVLIGKQQVYGVVYIPSDFENKLNRMEQTTISVYCDMSFMLAYKAIYQTATSVQSEMNSQIQIRLAQNTTSRQDEITTQPLAYEAVQIFNPTGGYGSFIIPVVLILIIQQTLLLGIGLSAGTARENNRYKDLVPISKHYNGIFRIVFGKALCYFMIYAVLSAYLLLIVPKIFNFTTLLEWKPLLLLMLPYLLAVIFFAMMLSCVVRYRENVLLLVVFTSVPLLFLSGASWPQSNIPGAWKAISYLFPSTFGIQGFVRLNSMGASLSEIQFEYSALWLQTLVYFLMTCLVYRFQINQARTHAIDRLSTMRDKALKARHSKPQEA